jgi:ATP-dependent DNA helicase RecG
LNQETQNTEWKRKWRDEFLKSLCGFANAQGGSLEIGREDDGTVVGVEDTHNLLEELPNIIRHTLGIVPSVELCEMQGKEIIIVSVEASHTPVSYRGKHYVRSGSTTQELSGSDLDRFILRKMGITWDGITVPGVKITDLDTTAFRIFRDRAVSSGRLQRADLDLTDEELLDNLALIENGELTRAAVMLFHHNPERFVFGAFVKIGYFETGADLRYYDEFHGSLITVADEIVETIYRKYFKAIISYKDVQRIETYPIPKDALREVIYNAMVHRDYTSGIPVQIKVFPDSVIIYNDGSLPTSWTVANLLEKHRSQPPNPKIAYGFYRAGYIETWGRGIERIAEACEATGISMPTFKVSGNEIAVTFHIDKRSDQAGAQDTINESDTEKIEISRSILSHPLNKTSDKKRSIMIDGNSKLKKSDERERGIDRDRVNDTTNDRVNDRVTKTQERILSFIAKKPQITATDLADKINITERNVRKNIKVLRDAGLLERVGAAKNGHWVVKKPEYSGNQE